MDEGGLAAFAEYIQDVHTYIEYGCGGSTVMAAQSGVKNIFAVDTAGAWVKAVREGTKDAGARVHISHCDLGEVADWGYPATKDRIADFHTYSILPWDASRARRVSPQLVLIDGRFRVASFLYSLLSARVGTTILFDDYIDRPQYHVVEQLCDLTEVRGRMGVFSVQKNFRYSEIAREFAKYSIVVE